MLVKLSQFQNVSLQILDTPSGIVTLVSCESENAADPSSAILSGSVTLDRLEQPKNAPDSITVTQLGTVTLVRFEQ